MSKFAKFAPIQKPTVLKSSGKGVPFVDYKDVENLRRCLSPNGKIYSQKRLGTTTREQHLLANAIKRARFMGLLPYTSATL
mgnify:CR=1 FL=1